MSQTQRSLVLLSLDYIVEVSDDENSLIAHLTERHTNSSATDRSSCDSKQIESEYVELNAPTMQRLVCL